MNHLSATTYPESKLARDRWILDRRGPREAVNADQPYAFLIEQERFANGEIGPVATIFLTNRECPWRCAMCDLWRHTLSDTVPIGAIPRQIAYALDRLPTARQIKLYNSGSFFDPRAIPPQDYAAIAPLVRGFERVIVESHPAMLGDRCLSFQKLLSAHLEIAMGLETVHPAALEKLNKRMTLDDFKSAADWLRMHDMSLRTFLLVQPPFIDPGEAQQWTGRSVDFALECGATAITLIATRAGNGSIEQLQVEGEFTSPRLAALEEALETGLLKSNDARQQGERSRIFADLWEVEHLASCSCCHAARVDRLRLINAAQHVVAKAHCSCCETFA